jgi:hypothetical protein
VPAQDDLRRTVPKLPCNVDNGRFIEPRHRRRCATDMRHSSRFSEAASSPHTRVDGCQCQGSTSAPVFCRDTASRPVGACGPLEHPPRAHWFTRSELNALPETGG